MVWASIILESISLMGQLVVHTVAPGQNAILRARVLPPVLFLYKGALTLPPNPEFSPGAFSVLSDLPQTSASKLAEVCPGAQERLRSMTWAISALLDA